VSFAYVPARDQNHVVRRKKPSDLFDVFLIIFEEVLKMKVKCQRENFVWCFLVLEKKFKYD